MLIRFTGIFVAAALTAGVANAKDITLRWGHYLGDSSFLQAEKDFATNVTERTEGRVKIEITYAGGLGAGNEVLTLAGRGSIDMASVVPGYYSHASSDCHQMTSLARYIDIAEPKPHLQARRPGV